MAAKKNGNKKSKQPKTPDIPQPDTYTHDQQAVQRPEVGVQAELKHAVRRRSTATIPR